MRKRHCDDSHMGRVDAPQPFALPRTPASGQRQHYGKRHTGTRSYTQSHHVTPGLYGPFCTQGKPERQQMSSTSRQDDRKPSNRHASTPE